MRWDWLFTVKVATGHPTPFTAWMLWHFHTLIPRACAASSLPTPRS